MVKSQLFKKTLNKEECRERIYNIILEYFEYVRMKKCYMLNNAIYRQLMKHNVIQELKGYIEPYYYDSKKNYPINMLSYKGFLTVLRQICNIVNISFTYHVNYCHSTYTIVYYFVIEEEV